MFCPRTGWYDHCNSCIGETPPLSITSVCRAWKVTIIVWTSLALDGLPFTPFISISVFSTSWEREIALQLSLSQLRSPHTGDVVHVKRFVYKYICHMCGEVRCMRVRHRSHDHLRPSCHGCLPTAGCWHKLYSSCVFAAFSSLLFVFIPSICNSGFNLDEAPCARD